MTNFRDMAVALLEVLNRGDRAALATVVRVSGSTPQRPGARLLLRADGSWTGTVGGGAIEHAVLDALRRVLAGGAPELVVKQLGYELGMCCGGRMEVFVEPIEAEPRLFICGAGHIAHATAPLAARVGFVVTIVDERDEQNLPERFPGCSLELRDPATWLRNADLTARDWLLIVTHDHRLDEEVLEMALRTEARYIGLVGSRRKAYSILGRIREKLGAELTFDRVYAPVGLDVGAVGPEEIAISILAELVAVRRGQAAPHLRLTTTAEAGEP